MKKLITALFFFIGLQAHAGLISVELDTANVNVGDVVGVTIVGSGFSAFDALSVDVEFDTSLFSLDTLSLGGDLFDAFPFDITLSSQVFGAAFSFLDFVPYAGGDFTIATFNLTALSAGTSDFVLTNALAGDFFTGPVDANASTQQVSATVPGPETFGLFAIALFVLSSVRKKSVF